MSRGNSEGPTLGRKPLDGKLRNAFNEVEGLAQFLGRKLRNHNPMSQIDKSDTSNTKFRTNSGTGQIGIPKDDRSKVLYQLKDGRKFEVAIREITDEVEELPDDLLKIGY